MVMITSGTAEVAGFRVSIIVSMSTMAVSMSGIAVPQDLDSTRIGNMRRWIFSIIVTSIGLLPCMGFAQGPWDAPAVQQAGFHQYGRQPGPGWHQQSDPNTMYQLLPDDRHLGSRNSDQFNRTLSATVSKSWIRFDYLMWDIKDFDNTLVGAPTLNEFDLTGRDFANGLPAVGIDGARVLTRAVVSDLGELAPNSLNGFRGTIGIPTKVGSFEADAWVLEDADEGFSVQPFSDLGTIVPTMRIGAVTLLDDGARSDDTMILFSEGMRIRSAVRTFGTEANWIAKPIHPNVGLEISPIIGFQYLRMQETLRIAGSDIADPILAPLDILNHRISASSMNHIYAPQLGFRAKAEFWKLTLGADTKLLFGINRYKDRVATSQIFSLTELDRKEEDEHTRFAPTLDLSLYAKMQVNDHLSFRVGYDLLYGAGYSRAHENISYDSSASATDPPEIGLDGNLTNFYVHGLTLSGELLLW